MNSIFLVISTVVAITIIFVLQFIICIVRKWLEARNLKQTGIEAQAHILQAQVINESGRYLSFVRFKLVVNLGADNSFTMDVDAFFSVPDLAALVATNIVSVKYNPSDLTQIIFIKKKQPAHNKESHSRSLVSSPDLVIAQ